MVSCGAKIPSFPVGRVPALLACFLRNLQSSLSSTTPVGYRELIATDDLSSGGEARSHLGCPGNQLR
eukprot:518549-Heterocapsa_arctica.AAC.1